MARYINYDELLEKWESLGFDEISRIYKVNAFNHFIKNLPTVDVVKVVRCEKCKHGDVSIFSKTVDGKEKIACYCNLQKAVMDVNWYCPNGERKTDNDV